MFFHYVLQGKNKQAFQTDKWKESYINEKKTLRAIAALVQLRGGDLL
jgi:hypothetical protein